MRILVGHRRAVRTLAYSPTDPGILASGGEDSLIRLWNLATGTILHELATHTSGITCLTFADDGKTLFAGGRNGDLQSWDLTTATLKQHLRPRRGPVRRLCWTPDRLALLVLLASGTGRPGDVLIWDPQRQSATVLEMMLGGVDLDLIPGGGGQALAQADRTIVVWAGDNPQGREIQMPRSIGRLAFGPDRQKPLLAVASGMVIELWDVLEMQRQAICKGHRNEVRALAFSPDGKTLVSGSWDRSVRTWNTLTGEPRSALDLGIGALHAVAVAPNGMTLAACGEKPSVVVWDSEF